MKTMRSFIFLPLINSSSTTNSEWHPLPSSTLKTTRIGPGGSHGAQWQNRSSERIRCSINIEENRGPTMTTTFHTSNDFGHWSEVEDSNSILLYALWGFLCNTHSDIRNFDDSKRWRLLERSFHFGLRFEGISKAVSVKKSWWKAGIEPRLYSSCVSCVGSKTKGP